MFLILFNPTRCSENFEIWDIKNLCALTAFLEQCDTECYLPSSENANDSEHGRHIVTFRINGKSYKFFFFEFGFNVLFLTTDKM